MGWKVKWYEQQDMSGTEKKTEDGNLAGSSVPGHMYVPTIPSHLGGGAEAENKRWGHSG